jgi:hypothetical protein
MRLITNEGEFLVASFCFLSTRITNDVAGNRELDGIEDGMNRANTSMEHVTRRTKALVDRAGGQRQFCIQVCLGIVALVLLLLVIYT